MATRTARERRAQEPGRSFYETLTDAINDIAEYGFDSVARLDSWVEAIRAAAVRDLIPEQVLEDRLREVLGDTYRRLVDGGGILRMHPGVSPFTLERVKPRLRAALDRRIVAAANLIRDNRQRAIAQTLQRFSGWVSSVPPGGTRSIDRRQVKQTARKALASLPFEERRVLIDQGHKFTANLSDLLATDGGAIAGVWHSHWRQTGYDYREDHKERDGKLFLVRDSWAIKRGLVNVGGQTYTDEITKPGEEVYCRCYYRWLYGLDRLPDALLTRLGRDALQAARAKLPGAPIVKAA